MSAHQLNPSQGRVLTIALWSKVNPPLPSSGKTSVWPCKFASEPGGRASSVPAESNLITYCPVSVNISRPRPRKFRFMDATSPLPLAFWQVEVGDAYDPVYLSTRTPKLGIQSLYVRIVRMSLLPVFSLASSMVLERGIYDWKTLYRLRHGCHCLPSAIASLNREIELTVVLPLLISHHYPLQHGRRFLNWWRRMVSLSSSQLHFS